MHLGREPERRRGGRRVKTTTAVLAAAAALAAAAGAAKAEEAPPAPRVLLLPEPNKPELKASAQGLLDALPREVVEPGISGVSPRLFQSCVFLIGPEPDKAEACAGPVIAAQNRRFAHTVVVLAADLPGGGQRWSCLAGNGVVSFGFDPSDRRTALAWAEACVSTAARLAPKAER